ncbi:MAG: hypothetical protein AMJ53_11975 [Gammaproteobacteria bacterium SG8_11]|nr:MAG: hypothetical protein AMJ53_11975 [Gammaproteobacteria bacterium SG8_11]
MTNSDSGHERDLRSGDEEALGPLSRLRLFFARLWRVLREITDLLRPCRFSIIVVVAGAGLLLVTAQGREIAVGLVDGPIVFAGVAFHFCVFLWAFESWYWARLMMEVVHGADRERAPDGRVYRKHEAWVKRNGPRVIAASAYSVAAVALILAGGWGHLIAIVVAAILFYWFLVKRITMANSLRELTFRLPLLGKIQLKPIVGDPGKTISSLYDLPLLSKVILGISLALSVLATVFVLVDAVGTGWFLGSAAVPFLGFALIVPVGSVLVYWSRFGGGQSETLGAKGYPVITMLILWALVVGLFVDNHQVRSSGPLPVDREALATAAERWHDQAVEASGSNEPPLVIVATAGGGIRAAYWTATVLGRLQDEEPRLRNYLFGVSGVSGGSLGATVFVTLLADGTQGLDTASCTDDDVEQGGVERKAFECAGQLVLGQDFLAPTVAALLFPDLMQRFVPKAVFPDRAQALEQSWEQAWGESGFAPDSWTRRTFSELWPEDDKAPYLPALFLNGTHVESGKRIITSNLKIDGSGLRDAYDFYALSSGDLLPSTAALNSARFTYVSPAGTLAREKAVGHIVDGGYFENFGAVTAHEVLAVVLQALEAKGKKARPILIQISNDPDLGEDDLDVDRITSPFDRKPYGWANEILSPVRALLKTRDARGVLAYKQFLRQVDEERRAHFRLCSVEGEADRALGWILAQRSMKLMQDLIRNDVCGNDSEVSKVLQAIR